MPDNPTPPERPQGEPPSLTEIRRLAEIGKSGHFYANECAEVVAHIDHLTARVRELEHIKVLLKWAEDDWIELECGPSSAGREVNVIRLERGQSEQRVFRGGSIIEALQLAHDTPPFQGETVTGFRERITAERDRLIKENGELREALAIYADHKNWSCNRCKGKDHINCFMGRWEGPCGKEEGQEFGEAHGYSVAEQAIDAALSKEPAKG